MTRPHAGSYLQELAEHSTLWLLFSNKQFLLALGLIVAFSSIALTIWSIVSGWDVEPVNLIKTYD